MGELIIGDFSRNRKSAPKISNTNKLVSNETIEKQAFFSLLIDRALTRVSFVPNADKTIIPTFLLAEPMVSLDWSHKFGLTDFEYDLDSIRGTLSFNGEPFYVVIPWDCIFLIEDPKNPSVNKAWVGVYNNVVKIEKNHDSMIEEVKDDSTEERSPIVAKSSVWDFFKSIWTRFVSIFGTRV